MAHDPRDSAIHWFNACLELVPPTLTPTMDQYLGFDTNRIQSVLLFRSTTQLRPDAMITIGANEEVPIGGEENLSKLVGFLIGLYNVRGNNLDGLADNTNFVKLRSALDLKSEVDPNNPNSRDTLTLTRIAAAFPVLAVSYATQCDFIPRNIYLSDIGIDQKNRVGKALAHSLAASILTIPMKKNGLPFVTFLAANRLHALIGGKKKHTIAMLWKLHKAILESTAASEGDKENFWNGLGELPATIRIDQAKIKLTELGASSELMAEIVQYCSSALVPNPIEQPEPAQFDLLILAD